MNTKSKTNNEKEKVNQNKSKNLLIDIKSKFILQKILVNIRNERKWKIIKYNKSIQQKLNLNINTFKEIFDIYSIIEIELIPKQSIYGSFINIIKEEEKYFHIYFNNDKKEIKRTKLYEGDKVSKINITINYESNSFHSFKELFFNCKCI